MKTLFIGLFLSSVVSYAQIRTATTTVGAGNEMDITVTINDFTGETTFDISGPTNKWFAAGFNTLNMNGYAIVLNNNGGNPDEYTMNGNGAPDIHTSQDLNTIMSSTSGTTKTFTFKRDNSTGNSDDYTFSTALTSLDIAYAIGTGPNLAYHSTNRGSGSLSFTDPCGTVVENNLGNEQLCNGEMTEIFGNMVGPGTYHDTIWSVLGCDSIINTKHAHYFETNASLASDGILQTDLPFHNNIWYSCDGDSIITGEENITFQPSVPGNYAVITSMDISDPSVCRDTSDCIMVSAQDLNINQFEGETINYYISNGTLVFQNQFSSEIRTEIFDVNGKLLRMDMITNSIDLSNLNGMVFIKLTSNNDKTQFKISLN